MLESSKPRRPGLRVARLPVCLLLLPATAFGLGLGEAQLRSHLGEALDVRIPLLQEDNEAIDRECFTVLPRTVDGVRPADRVTLTLERTSLRWELRAVSDASVREPAIALSIRVACPGAGNGRLERTYMLLPDPPLRPRAAAQRARGLTYTTQSGESLASLSRSLAGGGERARRQWVDAVRSANAALASVGDDDTLEEGIAVAVPAPAERARLPEASAANVVERGAPVPEATPPQRPRSARSARPAAVSPDAPAPPRERQRPSKPPRKSQESFALRLSGPQVDLNTRPLDEEARALLRERQLILESDDRHAALLALRRKVQVLETQLADMQLRLSVLAATHDAARPAGHAPPTERTAAPVESVPPATSAPPAQSAAPPAQPASPAQSASPTRSAPSAESAPAAEPSTLQRARPWAFFVAAVLLAFAALLGLRLARRRRSDPMDEESGIEPPSPRSTRPVPPAHAVASVDMRPEVPVLDMPPPAPVARQERQTVRPEAPRDVIEDARRRFEDGDAGAAIEALEASVRREPAAVRPWLALLEIHRARHDPAGYERVARGFEEHHAGNAAWPKVSAFGLELDPGNPLYQADGGEAHDPLEANWLEAPRPREGSHLAAELREAAMAHFAIGEGDLRPDPIPALRSAFSPRPA